jgi:NDP-sugar pyrophosphorylase family protein
MKVMVLAGGKATRLYPLTLHTPKQLLMLNGFPMIYYLLDHCKRNRIRDFIICVNPEHKTHFINALGSGSFLGVNISYSVSPEDFGTSGRILSAKNLLKGEDDFIVYYGDIICNLNLESMIKYHHERRRADNCVATQAITNSSFVSFGGCFKDSNNRILSFREKPRISEISDFHVSIGIGVYDSRIFKYCKPKDDLARETIPHALEKGEHVYGFPVKVPFYDIGTFSSIQEASEVIRRRSVSLGAEK